MSHPVTPSEQSSEPDDAADVEVTDNSAHPSPASVHGDGSGATTSESGATTATATAPNPKSRRWLRSPTEALTEAALRVRLIGSEAPIGRTGWILIAVTALVGGLLRFIRLGQPHSLVFDETYYVKDAYSYLHGGYERSWDDAADESFAAGAPAGLSDQPEYVVHPPLGKWLIAFGMWLFGEGNSFGWRFSAALVGTLSIVLVALAAHLLFRSTPVTFLAALLLAVDGLHIVMSRTSLLDIFLSFFVLAAFLALLLDRNQGRSRLARSIAESARQQGTSLAARADYLRTGPWLGLRPWRFAAGVLLGLALGTKWSALAFIAVFGIMIVLWDINARRLAGVTQWFRAGVLKDGLPALVPIVVVSAITYLITWSGWFASSDAYDRNWAADNPSSTWGWIPDSLRSLWHYHSTAYAFHQGLDADHPYAASAWTWLVLGRPTSFYYQTPEGPTAGCDAISCSQAVTNLGNPLIWWAATVALFVVVFWWIGKRDWRAGAILAGIAGGYLPWLFFPERTTFFFYAVAFEPFLILGLAMCLGLLLGGAGASQRRRRWGIVVVGVYMILVLLVSAFFLPIWTAEVIPYDHWQWRMWLPNWI